jgi:hypothetical protein
LLQKPEGCISNISPSTVFNEIIFDDVEDDASCAIITRERMQERPEEKNEYCMRERNNKEK